MRTTSRALALVAATAVLLSGCVTSEPDDPPGAPATPPPVGRDWSSASYSYTLDSQCGERALIGTYHVVVEGGVVTSAEPVAPAGWRPESGDQLASVPTFAHLLARAQATGNAAPSQFHVDPTTGVPTEVEFEGDPNAIDDEECYRISDYRPGAGVTEDGP
jgi:hypothetical protein